MTAFRRTAVTALILALLLLAACTPASPVAPAPTAVPIAATSTPAPTAAPTDTAAPEPTATATAAPTRTSTPEPTATPESRIKQENGAYTVMTEKGEALLAPAVPGTKQTVEQIAGKERVVYHAEAANSYGLETGALAGYFYPDTYTQTLEAKEASATGSLALRQYRENHVGTGGLQK